jgi:repressor LexA
MQSETIQQNSRPTPRQLELLRTTQRFLNSQGYSPTIGELASEMGVSRSTAFEHIDELRKKGLVSSCRARARSLSLTYPAQELLKGLTDQHTTGADRYAGIPLAGTVAAGSPIEAVEEADSLSLKTHFGREDDLFALKVTGNSMIDEDIRDGDYVICRRRRSAENGQLVVAILDDENATLKRFYKEKAQVRLQPANDDYAPIYAANCRIKAVVVGLVRSF